MSARRIDDIRPVQPTVRPRALPHLSPYVPPAPRRPQPPVTHIAPAKAGPQPPVVRDATVRSAGPVQPAKHRSMDIRPVARPRTQPVPPRPAIARPANMSVPTARPVQAPLPPAHTKPIARPASPATAPVPEPKKAVPKWRVALELAQYPLFAAIALVAANNSTIGQWFVLAYAVLALVLRLRSQVSFGMALFLLIAIPIFQLLGQAGIAQNIAVYVYELLVVGTLQAVLELYKTRHHKQADA